MGKKILDKQLATFLWNLLPTDIFGGNMLPMKQIAIITFSLFVWASCSHSTPKMDRAKYQTKSTIPLGAASPPPPPPPAEAKPAAPSKTTQRKKEKLNADEEHNTEDYAAFVENEFKNPQNDPLSTFSIDVDKASYANVRRFIHQNKMPPAGAVRIEELVNYFDYNYPQPNNEHPFSVNTQLSTCPWATNHLLLQIGLQGKKMELGQAPANNLVFLLDVSGSMMAADKLPLVKAAFKLLANNLRPIDRVAIVAYAGASGLVLPSTSGAEKQRIFEALDQLQAGGSTAGAEGIELAYKTAKEHFIKNGNNRVILATDGDFNVGTSSDSELQRLIEAKRKDGIFLTCMGYGYGNLKDNKMEILADKGNGSYYYIDNIGEANKVLGKELGGTLYTIAKDVKLQLEFNPKHVESYRLIGYENRILNHEDFNDDSKDAGELGAGLTVTAFYEIIPKGVAATGAENRPIDPLRYQQKQQSSQSQSEELVFVKLRYKQPDGDKSILLSQTVEHQVVAWDKTADNFKFATAVAAWGQILRGSRFKGNITFKQIAEMAKSAAGNDSYRNELVELVLKSEKLAK